MYFVIDGRSMDNGADGGNIEIQFLDQHLKTEYATLVEGKFDPLAFNERLYKMGFKEDEDGFRHVIQFNQRKLGE
jgi:hypothetical protein